jgi:hypothetical protein
MLFYFRQSEIWLFALSCEQFLVVEFRDGLLFAHAINIIIHLQQILSNNFW